MNAKKSQLDSLPESFKEYISTLSSEGLQQIHQSKAIALKYAKKGILQTEPENSNDSHIALIADGMQVLAKIILEERGILPKS